MASGLLFCRRVQAVPASATRIRRAYLTPPAGPFHVLAAVARPMTGVEYQRFFQPFSHLAERYVLSALGDRVDPDPGILDNVSLLLLPQCGTEPGAPLRSAARPIEMLCKAARLRRIPIVYSVDERFDPDDPDELLSHADAILVTTHELRRSLVRFHKPIYVLPNAVDPFRWSPRPRTSRELRVGWSGSAARIDDLMLLLPAIRKLQRRREFRFVVQGLLDRPLVDCDCEPEPLRDLCRQLSEVEHTHVPRVPTEQFFRVLPQLDLDLGLCPLLDTPADRRRSATRFYEYAVTGTMTIASRVTPYREEVSVTADNDVDGWCEAIERYLCDGTERERELERQRAYVLRERTIQRLKDRWLFALGEIQGIG
ncbi:MAG: glycosyltransferase family 4 protein [bacterium]|nr:glycosyltransferase family 4 protein [bacterium]